MANAKNTPQSGDYLPTEEQRAVIEELFANVRKLQDQGFTVVGTVYPPGYVHVANLG